MNPMICSSVNLFFFMSVISWLTDLTNFRLVRQEGSRSHEAMPWKSSVAGALIRLSPFVLYTATCGVESSDRARRPSVKACQSLELSVHSADVEHFIAATYSARPALRVFQVLKIHDLAI
jgi:hypothetical protein